jgi:hypothetical protein
LLPRTDDAVLIQAIIVFPVLLGALVVARRDREWRLLMLGLLTMTLAFFGLRAIH